MSRYRTVTLYPPWALLDDSIDVVGLDEYSLSCEKGPASDMAPYDEIEFDVDITDNYEPGQGSSCDAPVAVEIRAAEIAAIARENACETRWVNMTADERVGIGFYRDGFAALTLDNDEEHAGWLAAAILDGAEDKS